MQSNNNSPIKADSSLVPVKQQTYKDWIKEIPSNFPYRNPAILPPPKGSTESRVQFPIIASGIKYANSTNALPSSSLQQVNEAGFNVCMQGALDKGDFEESLKNAYHANLNVITRNHDFFSRGGTWKSFETRDYVKEVLPILGGVFLFDEPTYKEIVGISNTDNFLQSAYYDLMRQEPPINRILVINLIGGPEKAWMSNPDDSTKPTFEDYKEYVQTFQDYFKPSYFSYDRYPIREKATILYEGIFSNLKYDGTEGEITVDGEFYNYLNFFHEFTSKKDIDRPFWVFCQSQSFMSLTAQFHRPAALEQYLRFEVFSALAYGAKGIQYWSYPVSVTNPNECFLSALTDRRNRPTAAWHFAKRVNEQIHKYSDIFLNARLKSITYPVKPTGTYFRIQSDRQSDFFLSSFEDEESLYAIIVSRDPLNYQNLVIYTRYDNMIELTPEKSGGEENVLLPANTAIKRILIPGGMRILKRPK